MKLLFTAVIYCLAVFALRGQASDCTTPNGESAQCVPLPSCYILKNAALDGDATEKAFVRASFCGATLVCCGTTAHFTRKTDNTSETKSDSVNTEVKLKREYALKNLVPNKTYCGLQHFDDYYHSQETNATSVDEFPWLIFTFALNQTSRLVYHTCSGVIINSRYALTAGFCGKNDTLWATVGHYQSFKPQGSCIQTDYGEYCTGDVRDVRVEEQIKSPDGELLLIRFDIELLYSDFLRPICLPIIPPPRNKPNDTGRATNGSVVYTSGWADSLEGKKKIKHRVVATPTCKVNDSTSICIYADTYGVNVGKLGNSDAGGPLMFNYNPNWIVEGIVTQYSKDPQNLRARKLTPKDINWILDNLKQ